MSRTFRRMGKGKMIKRFSGARTRNREFMSKDLPPIYKNARRTYCAAAGTTKWWFRSKGAAIEAAKYNCRERRERGGDRKFERAYECKTCGGFHLSTMDWQQWQDRKVELARVQGIELDDNGNFAERKPLREYYNSDSYSGKKRKNT